EAFFQRSRINEGLETRARLTPRLGDMVELVFVEIFYSAYRSTPLLQKRLIQSLDSLWGEESSLGSSLPECSRIEYSHALRKLIE
ncbi:MAG: hypothetical protein EBW84_02160, partial [Betaproteobacteria bacterium]|nr:hypothetical protein [Betaproteobacteria bacterium]